MYNGYIGVKCT